MIKKTLYFENPAYLHLAHAQCVIRLKSSTEETIKTIPVEDIGLIILDHPQISISQALCQKLIANNSAIVWCNEQHLPSGITLSMCGNDTYTEKLYYQLEASVPLKKQLWKQTIEYKIKNQALVLRKLNKPYEDLLYLADQVKSGDPYNVEAQAASRYWDKLLTPYETARGQFEGPPNNFLNYAYAILRSLIAKSLVGSGLLPALGIHHHNKYNPYCLADDIMEPYRPIVDYYIFKYLENSDHIPEMLGKEEKAYILNLVGIDVDIEGKKSPLMVGCQRTSASLMKCFIGESKKLAYPIMR